MELIGQNAAANERQTVVSGAQALPSQSPTAPRSQVALFRLSGWPDFAPPPSRGFGQPIRPVTAELFLGDRALPVAAWPNAGYGRLERPSGIDSNERRTFAVAGRDASKWRDEVDLQAFAFWFHDWAAQTYPVNVSDDGFLVIDGNGSPYGIKGGQRVRIESALSELDRPGEWFLNRKDKQLHVWLPEGSTPGDLELSLATGLLHIEDSRGISIRNIAFEKSRGDAITVRNSEDVVLDSVSIRHTGNRALVIEGGERCGIRDSLIEHTGEGAVSLSGGDRRSLKPASHFVEGSVIRDFSRLSKTYRFAVEMDGVGQRAVGNVISEAPHTAILFTGNDHRIAGNEIFDVVRETGDAGAIYTGRDYTARGTIIEGNCLRDIQADAPGREVKGVYLDDQASGITVRRNVFIRVQQPVFIGGGRDNLVEDNVFYQSSPAIHLDARGLGWQRAATLDPKRELQTRLDAVPYREPPYSERYPNLRKIREDDLGAPKYNVARGNKVIDGQPYRVHPAAAAGIELGEVAAADEDALVRLPMDRIQSCGDFVAN